MRIYSDSRLFKSKRHDDIRRFPSNAGQLEQFVQLRRHFSAKLRQQLFANPVNRPRLYPVKPLPINAGLWNLEYEFFAIGFPVLVVLLELTFAPNEVPQARKDQ